MDRGQSTVDASTAATVQTKDGDIVAVTLPDGTDITQHAVSVTINVTGQRPTMVDVRFRAIVQEQ